MQKMKWRKWRKRSFVFLQVRTFSWLAQVGKVSRGNLFTIRVDSLNQCSCAHCARAYTNFAVAVNSIEFTKSAYYIKELSPLKDYTSLQIPNVGSVFLGTLYRAIERYGDKKDILSLLTITQSAISEYTVAYEGNGVERYIEKPDKKELKEYGAELKIHLKQMPNFYSTLTKFFILPVPEKQ